MHADQSTTRLLASSGVQNTGGAVQFFGVLSIDRPFIAVRFGNTAPVGYDGFVFDDLTIGTTAQLAPVPEPGSLATLLAGLVMVGTLVRRSSAKNVREGS